MSAWTLSGAPLGAGGEGLNLSVVLKLIRCVHNDGVLLLLSTVSRSGVQRGPPLTTPSFSYSSIFAPACVHDSGRQVARGSTRPSSSGAFLFFFVHKTRPEDPQSIENHNLEGEPDLAGDFELEIDPGLEGHPGFERALSDVDPFPKARERILNGNARHANNNQRARYAPRVPPHQPGHEEDGNPFSIAFNAKWNRLNSHTLTRRLSTTQTRLAQTKACPVTRQRESNCFDHA